MNDELKNTMASRLDEVRDGAALVVALAQKALAQASEDLGKGNLDHAVESAQAALSRIGSLQYAYDNLGVFHDKYVVAVPDIEVGMDVFNRGKVEHIEEESRDCTSCGVEHDYLKLHYENGAEELLRVEGELAIQRVEAD